MKTIELNKATILLVLVFSLILTAAVRSSWLLASSAKQSSISVPPELLSLRATIAALPEDAFDNPNQKQALLNKIDAVISQIEAGAIQGAVSKLLNDVRRAVEEWIEDSQTIIDQVNAVIDALDDYL